MSAHVHWVVELTIKEGQSDAFMSLMREMTADTEANQPDALNYEWFIADDGKTGHIYERYRDSAATLLHLAWFGDNFAEPFLGLTELTKITVYGDPSDEVKAHLAGLGPVFMEKIGGFAR